MIQVKPPTQLVHFVEEVASDQDFYNNEDCDSETAVHVDMSMFNNMHFMDVF